jgi:hypothetical protein
LLYALCARVFARARIRYLFGAYLLLRTCSSCSPRANTSLHSIHVFERLAVLATALPCWTVNRTSRVPTALHQSCEPSDPVVLQKTFQAGSRRAPAYTAPGRGSSTCPTRERQRWTQTESGVRRGPRRWTLLPLRVSVRNVSIFPCPVRDDEAFDVCVRLDTATLVRRAVRKFTKCPCNRCYCTDATTQ